MFPSRSHGDSVPTMILSVNDNPEDENSTADISSAKTNLVKKLAEKEAEVEGGRYKSQGTD